MADEGLRENVTAVRAMLAFTCVTTVTLVTQLRYTASGTGLSSLELQVIGASWTTASATVGTVRRCEQKQSRLEAALRQVTRTLQNPDLGISPHCYIGLSTAYSCGLAAQVGLHHTP